jgi:hypothetical protein
MKNLIISMNFSFGKHSWQLLKCYFVFVCLLLSITIFGQAKNAKSWKNCTSIQDVYHLYPDHIHNLFNKLDLNYPGFEKIQSAVKSNQYHLACELLIAYYKEKAIDHFHNVQKGEFDKRIVNNALQDSFTITAYTDKVPRTEDDGLDWYWIPPEYYNNQWHQLTRHGWWNDLLNAYYETKEKKYAQYLDLVIRDWCVHEQKFNVFNINGPDNYVMPTKHHGGDRLDAGSRIGKWPRIFYSLSTTDIVNDATILLMLNSIYKHGDYIEDTFKSANHLIIEMTGLMNIGISFPEFKDAVSWLNKAENSLINEWDKQILPDGAQYELSHGYHQGVMGLYFQFKELFEHSGRNFPQDLYNKMEQGVNYSAYVMNPQQMALMNNDSPEFSLKNWILDKAEMFNRSDWKYIATNGKIGEKPKGLPSSIFPWAGHFITRNNWEKEAHWSFFDVGPWGQGHQHNDKLHISLYAHGRQLLVDAGKYTYRSDEWRDYFRGSKSHNVILVNDNDQNKYDKLYDSAFGNYEITKNVDFCMSTFSSGWNNHKGKHTRALVYIKDKYWIIFDRIEAGNSRIKTLWHFHPSCHVVTSDQEVKSHDKNQGNLLIYPISNQKWDIALKKGETDPIQGWYSKDRGYKIPAYCAEYSAKLNGTQTFAWLLYPKNGQITSNEFSVEIIQQTSDFMRIEIQENDVEPIEITVNLSGTKEPIILGDGKHLNGNYSVIRKNK